MDDRPRLHGVYWYSPSRGDRVLVKVIGFRGLSWIETTGVNDGQRRDVPQKQLSAYYDK